MVSEENVGLYSVHHFTGEEQFRTPQAIKVQPRRFVGAIHANHLQDAFTKAQNFNSTWATCGVRSSCVGDVIVDPSGRAWLVKSLGFSLIENFEDSNYPPEPNEPEHNYPE